MGYHVAGSTGLHWLPSRRRRNSEGAWTTYLRAKGLEETILAFVAGLPEDSEIEITPEDDSPFATLEYSVGDAQDGSEPTEENLKPQWYLISGEDQKDLYELPGLGATLADTAAAITRIEEGLKNIAENPSWLVTEYNNIETAHGAKAAHIFYLKARGQETYFTWPWTLQKIVNLPKGYSQKWDITNVGKQYTTEELTASEAIPETIKFTMPAGVWIKKGTQIVPDGDGRFQITEEWLHGEAASTYVYPPVEIEP